MFFWSRLEREGVGSDDGGRAFGAQSAPNHWAERGKGRVTGVQVFVQVLVCSPIWREKSKAWNSCFCSVLVKPEPTS